MRQIGFKNFRRFENFPSIDLSPITIFVGENNAGKSTVVKGILALSDFLNRWMDDFDFLIGVRYKKSGHEIKAAIVDYLKNQKFYFNTSYLAHIGTFKRALYYKAKSNVISFFTKLGLQDLTIDVCGDRDNEEVVSGVISRICLDYQSFGIHIEFDLQNDSAVVTFRPVNVSAEGIEYPSSKRRFRGESFLNTIDKTYELKYNISDYFPRFAPELISALTASVEIAISACMDIEKTNEYIGIEMLNKLKPIESVDEETVEFFKQYTASVCDNRRGGKWIFRLPETRLIRNLFSIEYLYAHAVTQTVIYSAKDTNDYLSRTIHEFASMPKSDDDYQRAFITQWMKEFGIGQDYRITSVGGEAHIVKIQNKDEEWVNLSDKGMGSIQLMVLLFRLAITLPKLTSTGDGNRGNIIIPQSSRIIIIEEPEQNLHPMLQSKLADLLFDLYQKYGYCFIIETHSEYLIRKTQVIVKENFNDIRRSLKDNPFKVFYFNSSDSENPCYEIIYQKDGSFSNDFCKGFFDEASNLAFEIL